MSDQAIENARPLTATASRALAKLVDLDFANVEAEVRQLAEVEADRRVAEVEKQWDEKIKAAAVWKKKGEKLVAHFLENAVALKNLASDSGVLLNVPTTFRYDSAVVDADVPGLDLAKREARDAVSKEQRRALTALERARLTSQRTVMLATVTAEAEQVLSALPSAREVFLSVGKAVEA